METPAKKLDLEIVANLFKEFSDALKEIEDENILKRLMIAIQVVKSYLRKLREYCTQRDFKSSAEEISFFKSHKPRFFVHLFYYSELYRIHINKPIAAQQSEKEYYQSELEKIRTDFEQNKAFYSYIRSGEVYLDEEYFIRGKQSAINTSKLFSEVDPSFSTGYDFLVAAYWANEKLADYLNKKLAETAKPSISFNTPTHGPKITWTDTKTALIELIYAFKTKGSFNQGTATLKEISDYLQQVFSVELNNPSRDFQEILRRKTGYTTYLDSLKESYLKYIDDIENRPRR